MAKTQMAFGFFDPRCHPSSGGHYFNL